MGQSNLPSSRKDGFGTKGIGEGGDGDMGTTKSGVGGTGSRDTGGTQGHRGGTAHGDRTPANRQGAPGPEGPGSGTQD